MMTRCIGTSSEIRLEHLREHISVVNITPLLTLNYLGGYDRQTESLSVHPSVCAYLTLLLITWQRLRLSVFLSPLYYLLLSLYQPVSNISFTVSNISFTVSNISFTVLNILFNVSSILFTVSNISFTVSIICYIRCLWSC